MNKYMYSAEKKKALMEILAQAFSESDKPDRRPELIRWFQLDPGAHPSYFYAMAADWFLQRENDIRNDITDYFQQGKFKSMPQELRDSLIAVFKKYDKRVSELEKEGGEYHPNMLMKHPYMNYPMMYHPSYVVPHPGMMPPAYPDQRMMSMMGMHPYFVPMGKYPPYPQQHYLPPYMGSQKYSTDIPQAPSEMPKAPYYPYHITPTYMHENPYMMPPTPHQGAPSPMPVPSQSQSQAKAPGVSKGQYEGVKGSKDYEGSWGNYGHEDEVYGYSKKTQGQPAKQITKTPPFFIIAPSNQKLQREEIPEFLPKHKIRPRPIYKERRQNENNDSSEILILQKGHDDTNKYVSRRANVPKPKAQPLTSKLTTTSHYLTTAPQIVLGGVYRQIFRECLCKGYGLSEDYFTCYYCNSQFHYTCTQKKKPDQQNTPENEGSKQQQCHFCFMKQMDPLNKVETVIKATYIPDIRKNKFIEVIDCESFDKYFYKGSPYQLQLRCMRLEDASNMVSDYTFPDECIFMLNEEKNLEFPALQNNSSLKKRKDSSFFITPCIYQNQRIYEYRKRLCVGLEMKQFNPVDASKLKIKNHYIFITGLYLIRKKTPDELCLEIFEDPTNKVKFAEKFFSSTTGEDQIEIEQIKVNLMDPFSWNLIDIPARGHKCIHGQCFDLKTFIGFMNVQKHRQWKCPVCNKECRHFYVDTQIQQAIKEFKMKESEMTGKKLSKEIAFRRDGRTQYILQNDDQDDDDKNGSQNQTKKTKTIAKEEKDP